MGLGWVWAGFGLGLGWVWAGFGLGLGWVWVGFGLGLDWIGLKLSFVWLALEPRSVALSRVGIGVN